MLAADVVGHSSQPVVTDVALWFVGRPTSLNARLTGRVVPLFPLVYRSSSTYPASLARFTRFFASPPFSPFFSFSLFYCAVYLFFFVIILISTSLILPRLSNETRSSSLRFFPTLSTLLSSPLYFPPPFPRPVKLPSLHRLSSVYTVKCPALISVGKHCKFLLTRLPSRYHVKLAESNESIDHPLWWNRCISPSSSPSPSLTDPSSFLQNSGKIRENSRESLSNRFSSFVSRFRSECVHGHV